MAIREMGATFNSRLAAIFGVTVLAFLMVVPSYAAEDIQIADFEIRPQSLQSALLRYSEQASVQLILAADTSGLSFRSVISGQINIETALGRLLAGTGLGFEFTSPTTVTITQQSTDVSVSEEDDNSDVGVEKTTEQLEADTSIEEIILVGTRAKGRSAVETAVPVDMVTKVAMSDTGQYEVGRILQVLAPSFNFSTSAVSDGTDALRPATLRGLGPDQTLVLINGKRRHTAALVHVNTSVGRGTAGVDLNAVPGSALEGIEILRDGAAAQYGSDAIAGVINLRLNERSAGGEVSFSYGQTYEGDGASFISSANAGLPLLNDGFVNLTAEYSNRGATNRAGLSGAVQYPLIENGGGCNSDDNSGCDPKEFSFERQNFRIGDADSEHKALVLNSKLPLTTDTTAYLFGTYSDRHSQSAGFYRRANDYQNTVREIYPDGFLPLINTHIEDYSVTGGVDVEGVAGWSLDLSLNHGKNQFQFVIENSLNASFGSLSATKADAGTLAIQQTSFNIDAVRSFEFGEQVSTFAFGAEYREETYEIRAGEPVSYLDGGELNANCTGCDVSPVPYASGFQVFRGFSPENQVDQTRSNLSFYADVESKISSKWLVTAAVRFEDYSDFGNKLTGKFSSRYQLTPQIALRGSISSGFRAPAMQQKFFNSVSTQFVEPVGAPVDAPFGATVAQQRGTFRNDSLVARLAGVPALKEETAFSYSAGVVFAADKLTITLDAYHIGIKDRIGISGAIDLMQPGFEELAGVASSGQFFVNAADTETNGLDVIATYDVALENGNSLFFTATGNWTETSVDKSSLVSSIGAVNVGPLFTPQDISIIEEWQPKTRAAFSLKYVADSWSVVARLNHFGSYTVCEGSCDTAENIQKFGAKELVDIQVSYNFPDAGMKFSVGANNIFNAYPDRNVIGQSRAGDIAGIVSSPGVFQYSRRSAPFGFNGGYWYARATYSF